jgi:LCP family protein required for cell wall assembly
MAQSSEPTASDDAPRFKARHTRAQRVVLATNMLVIVGCFAGATALIAGKNVRESLSAAPNVTLDTTPTLPGTPTSVTIPASVQPGVSTLPAGTGPTSTFPVADAKAENFLITGDDNNACVSPDSPWAGAVTNRESLGSRSDTIMVMRVDPVTHAAAVLSFPRDLWVKIPGRGMSRINSAYQKGQYDVMAQTLHDNFGVDVDHFIQIDFCAFKTIVDAVGGVAVPFAEPIRDAHVGLDIENAGCHTFSGDEALAYVRTRHLQYLDNGTWKGDGTSDYGRISRQQDFLRRMLKAALNKGFLDVSVARGFLEAARKYIVFDQNLSIDDMLSFAGLLRDIQPADIRTYQVQALGKNIGGAAVLIPQLTGDNMKAILAVFKGEATLAGAPAQTDVTVPGVPTTVGAGGTAVSTSVTGTSAAASSTVAPDNSAAAGRVTSTLPGASTSVPRTTTSTTSTTSTTVAGPVATNPDDIIRGVVPDKNATCPA